MEVTEARYSYDTYANVTYQSFTWQAKYSGTNAAFAYDYHNQVTAWGIQIGRKVRGP